MRMKALFLGVAMALGAGGLVVSPAANAGGIPVFDASNLVQQIRQYIEMINQLRQLEAQLKQAQDHFKSITGSRGLGNILQENFLQNMPTNWQETLAGMEGAGNIAGLARDIYDAANLLQGANFENVAEDVLAGLEQGLKRSANAQALNAQAFEGSAERFDRIQGLMNRINTATDSKAIDDLQGRIAAENAMLMNELVKLQAMNALLQEQRQVAQQEQIQSLYAMTAKKYKTGE